MKTLFDLAANLHAAEWKEAKCLGKWDMFYPPEDATAAQRRTMTKNAKILCASCPLRQKCKEQARNEEYGTWHGQSETDRRDLQRIKRTFGLPR